MDEFFHRPAYAQEIARDLLQPGPLKVGLQSGVFLSGIRRVGKTTFLRQDLIPALQAEGALPIYVDLWADKLRAPSSLVHEAVAKTIKELETPDSRILAALRRVNGLDVGVGPLKLGIKLDKPGAPGNATLADVFAELVRLVKTNVVVIVDEVQHAVGSEDGMNMLHALKAARDRINTDPDMPGKFIFLGTGSHKSLVTDMATRRSHPFAGATAVSFRVLGQEFVAWRLEEITRHEPLAVLPSLAVAVQGFTAMGNRPEELGKALVELQRQFSPTHGPTIDQLYLSICQTRASAAAEVEIATIEGFGLLGSAIFSRIAHGRSSGLFSSDALTDYAQKTGVSVDVPQVQNTADKMIAANLIMRMGHGVYDVSDPFVKDAWLTYERHYHTFIGGDHSEVDPIDVPPSAAS